MNKNEDKAPVIIAVIERLRKGDISEDMCEVIKKYPSNFSEAGVYLNDVISILDMKAKSVFCPDPLSYSILDEDRINYIYKSLDNPDMKLGGENEQRFATALSCYYLVRSEYKLRLDGLVKGINDKLTRFGKEVCDSYVKDNAADLLGRILFKNEIPPITIQTIGSLQAMFDKYDLHDVYNMADNKLPLQWKAALGAESEGLLDDGIAEVIFIDAGINTNEIEDRIIRYQIDKLRISKAEVYIPSQGVDSYIRCHVDGKKQPEKNLSEEDKSALNGLVNVAGLAVKYYQDVLDRNRENNEAVADRKTLMRMNMNSVDRLMDIYHNGLSKEDVMLLKASEEVNSDKFWTNHEARGLEEKYVGIQKDWAFENLVHHVEDLRPGMLTDDELILLTQISSELSSPKREGEKTLMHLPEIFYPLIEESGEHQPGLVNYVKVLKNIGRITPDAAYHSMHYYLENRLEKIWDLTGSPDENGRIAGCNYYPNRDMKNPSEMFAPNLLTEQQWRHLCERYKGEAAAFVPYGAFRKDRVTEVQVYPVRDGGMAIRCRVDEQQQSGQLLSEVDIERYNEGIDVRELAAVCFSDAFAREEVLDYRMQR